MSTSFFTPHKHTEDAASNHYVAGIDGLRAIAVIAVVVFHLKASFLPGGFVGVDIFFVISGYVISQSLSKNTSLSLPDFLLGFYKRRVLRIFPALVACLFLTGLVSVAFIPHGFWLSEQNRWTGLWAFFGVSNFYLVNGLDGYFSSRTDFNPFVHTWSLGVEEQFYLIFPLILYVCLQQKSRPTQYKNLYYLLLPALAAMSFLWSIYQTNTAHGKAFYLLPSRFWELAAGALLYQIHSHPNGYLEKIKGWAAPVGATLLVIGFVFANKSQFPFPWAFVPVVATVLLLIAVTTPNQKSIFLSVFTASSLRYVGRLSYSLYLWHWPVFVLCRWTVGLGSAYTMCFAIALTLVLAVISHHSIENHFRDHIVFKTQPAWKTVFSGGMAIAFASVVLGSVYYLSKPMGWSLSVTQNECVWQPYNSNCQPRTNATKTNLRLFITGDSHAGAYKLMAETAAARFGASVHIRSYAGNPLAKLIDIEKDQRLYQRAYNETLAWIDRYAQPGDIVFLASLRIQRLGNQWGSFNPELVQQEALSATQNETRRNQ